MGRIALSEIPDPDDDAAGEPADFPTFQQDLLWLRYSARRIGDSSSSGRVALVCVLLAHALAFWMLARFDVFVIKRDVAPAIQVSFIEQPRPDDEVIVIRPPAPALDRIRPPARPVARPISPSSEAHPLAVTMPEATDQPIKALYNPDGSLRLPDGLVKELSAVESEQRVFEFQIPNLDRAGKILDRPPALDYQATRFDRYWQPNQDLLTEILSKAVEKTTKEIRIPVPGEPGAHIVCQISLLAMGGGCGIVHNNDHYVVALDDPDTLSPEEEKQCAAWWEQIVHAQHQDIWRRTRALYETSCRKPPERTKAQQQ